MKTIGQSFEESNAYSLFVYAFRSQVTRDYYLRRLKIFFNHIDLLSDKTMEERCNYFAQTGKNILLTLYILSLTIISLKYFKIFRNIFCIRLLIIQFHYFI